MEWIVLFGNSLKFSCFYTLASESDFQLSRRDYIMITLNIKVSSYPVGIILL